MSGGESENYNMIKKNKEFKLGENDIFLNDKLNRKEAIENLSSLLISTKEAFTMSINANWGAGKTTFVKLWKEHLLKEYKVNSIYFSAWEDDFSKEPLIPIMGELNAYIADKFQNDKAISKKLEDVGSLAGKVLKRALPTLIKSATHGAIDVGKDFENIISTIAEQSTQILIETYSKEKEITKKFKESMKGLLDKIDKTKPFVIFIDELDRCRPLYAIELLERIKHIFGIDGLIFVFSIDKKQLCESIKSQYGNIDAPSYLKRFIDLEYNLQDIGKDDFCIFLYKSYNINDNIKSKGTNKTFSHDFDDLAMLRYCIKQFDLTLREIEQAFIQIDIVFKTMEFGLDESHFRVFIFFILLKIKKQNLYFDLINKNKSPEEIIKEIFLNKNSEHELNTNIESIVYATLTTDEDLKLIIKNKKDELNKNIDNASEQQSLINLLSIDYSTARYGLNIMGGYGLNHVINTVIKKVEFLDKFNFDTV